MKESNKRLARNSILLYFRMFVTMGVGIFTSRLILQALGVVDYGIYGIVGGIVTLFSFLNSSMSSATQRYLSFDLGRNDYEQLKKTFCTTLNIHFLIALVSVFLAETFGLWFLNNKLDIPFERMEAANVVYQFSILTFFFSIIQVPYSSLLIARERMDIYAYVSILEAFLKMLLVLLLLNIDYDRLILFSILTFSISVILQVIYITYSRANFIESRYEWYFNKKYFRELLSYSGWNLFGNIAAVARNQGGNILLNIFFGPVINAAYSLSSIVQGIVSNFVIGFQTSINPQIVKNYANGNIELSHKLIFQSAKFSFFAMFVVVLPILYNLAFLLHLWLVNFPPYTREFVFFSIIISLLECISNPLMNGLQATGKIKVYQAVVGSLIFLNLPIAWIILKYFNDPIYLFYTIFCLGFVSLFFRLIFIKKLMDLNVNLFFKQVLFRIFVVVTIVIFLLSLLSEFFSLVTGLLGFLLNSFFLVIIAVFTILIFGLQKSERVYLFTSLKTKFL